MRKTVTHPLSPWIWKDSEVLVLGTLPSPASRQRGLYYGHPQNRFWPTLAQVFGEPRPIHAEACRDFARRHHIALWDVFAQADIQGADDSSIVNAHYNDLAREIKGTAIHHIFCTGQKAWQAYQAHWGDRLGLPAASLPSTSPANRAHWPDAALPAAYQVIREVLTQPAPFPGGRNLFALSPLDGDGAEQVEVLYAGEGLRLERIISRGHCSPDGFYYDQDELEWVAVLEGQAILADDRDRHQVLNTGDHVLLAPHVRHRVVASTDPCIWLACFKK
ncbi:DNA-deoxyinosine glycosylase [Peptococcus simiae]|uniref:DNA-deoxyinosine glycosylase n=1 Tax=Peptococcus simiae TaxID=1643805 RepID=A0ABW9GY20_9FIRM